MFLSQLFHYHDSLIILIFRNINEPKRIFWFKDHQTDSDIVEEVYPYLRQAGTSISTVEVRSKLIRDYKKAKLELISQCEHLQGYELVQDDQLPADSMALSAWLVRNQTRAMATEQVVFMDFKAPLEIEALLVPKTAL